MTRFTMRRSAHGGFYLYDWHAPAEDRTVGLFRTSGDARAWIADTLAGRGTEVIFQRVPKFEARPWNPERYRK